MSGICAIVNFDGAPVDPQILEAMARQCAYRGPDGIRYWIQENVGLAHLALHATPEALQESQPQLSNDGMLCLTADARIDNRPELIDLLIAKGQLIGPESTDADLILSAYRVWGKSCSHYVIGDYAFAIWNTEKQQLFCVRDIYGAKSLHYARIGSLLCVASEAQQIIQHPKVPRVLDEVRVADFLIGYRNNENRTMFQGVFEVPRANQLIAGHTDQHLERYWDIDPAYRITYKNNKEYAAHFLEIFRRAGADRMRTQGETIGVTMSGGMDSTSIAAIAQQISNNQSGKPHPLACSYAFDYFKESDERPYSQKMTEELGVELIYIPAENFWYLDNEETYTPSLETPFMGGDETLFRHALRIFAERGAYSWFSGHGGDCVLGGSPLIYADRLQRGDINSLMEVALFCRVQHLPYRLVMQFYWEWFFKPIIPLSLKKLIRRRRKAPDWLSADFVRRTRLIERQMDSHSSPRYSDRARQANYEYAVHIDQIQSAISREERLGASFHMEARDPFLDRRLVEFMMAIPPEQAFQAGLQKFILRESMRGILPETIRTRPFKTDFTRYMGWGLKQKETAKIRALFETPLLNKLNLVNLSRLHTMYESYLSGSPHASIQKLFRCVSLEIWLKKYFHLLTASTLK